MKKSEFHCIGLELVNIEMHAAITSKKNSHDMFLNCLHFGSSAEVYQDVFELQNVCRTENNVSFDLNCVYCCIYLE